MSMKGFEVHIEDLRHNKCKVSLEMKEINGAPQPYCSHCDQYIHTADIEINPNWETQKKIIEMILVIGSLEYRLKKQREHP